MCSTEVLDFRQKLVFSRDARVLSLFFSGFTHNFSFARNAFALQCNRALNLSDYRVSGEHMSLKHIVIGTTIFTAGVLTSNHVRHGIATFIANTAVPAVSVTYGRSGTYVNGQKVDSLGRVGGARCDWDELEATRRKQFVLHEFAQNKDLANTYLAQLSTQDQMNTAYRAMVILARKAGGTVTDQMQDMKDAIGFRADVHYTPTDTLR